MAAIKRAKKSARTKKHASTKKQGEGPSHMTNADNKSSRKSSRNQSKHKDENKPKSRRHEDSKHASTSEQVEPSGEYKEKRKKKKGKFHLVVIMI